MTAGDESRPVTPRAEVEAQVIAELVRHSLRQPPRLALRVSEAAAALGVSVDYFSARIAPDLRVVRDGRTKLVPVEELRRWLDEHAAYAIGPRID